MKKWLRRIRGGAVGLGFDLGTRVGGTLVLVVALASVTSCDEPTVVEESTTSQYFDLVSFWGMPLPATIPPGGGTVIVSGRFLISSDESCVKMISSLRASDGEMVDWQSSCAWTQDGSELSFTWAGSSISTGSIVGDILTVLTPTGAVCITFPCPSFLQETYVRVAGS